MTDPNPGDRWYFGYGSNLQEATFRGRRGIVAKEVRIGRLAGFSLCFDLPIGPAGRGVANLAPDETAEVWGALYLLTAEQNGIIDRTEGVPSGAYRRIAVSIETDAGPVDAETLISERRDPSRRPSHRYMSIILEGARERGLPEPWIDILTNWPLAWDERKGASNPAGLRPD